MGAPTVTILSHSRLQTSHSALLAHFPPSLANKPRPQLDTSTHIRTAMSSPTSDPDLVRRFMNRPIHSPSTGGSNPGGAAVVRTPFGEKKPSSTVTPTTPSRLGPGSAFQPTWSGPENASPAMVLFLHLMTTVHIHAWPGGILMRKLNTKDTSFFRFLVKIESRWTIRKRVKQIPGSNSRRAGSREPIPIVKDKNSNY